MTVVYLTDRAFISILLSAIQSFPWKYEREGRRKPKNVPPEGEAYGLLFGQRIEKSKRRIFNVNVVVPMQILETGSEHEVTPPITHFGRIKTVLDSYPMFQYLGTYHSHPCSKDKTGGFYYSGHSSAERAAALEDARELQEEVIEVTMGITFLDRRPKRKSSDIHRVIIENYCGNYKYSLSAYITDSRDEGLEELYWVENLICPLAAGIGNYDLNT